MTVGSDGGWGELRFDASHAYLDNASMLMVGDRGGNGSLTLTRGSALDLGANSQTAGMYIGYGAASSVDTQGSLLIDGGSALRFSSRSSDYLNSDGYYNYNPYVMVGRNGNGTLSIRGGSSLVIQGLIPVRPDDYNGTTLVIGSGSSQHAAGSYGMVQVSGAGSLLEVSGYDAAIYAGASGGSIGQIAVLDNASLRTTLLQVGNGSLNVDRASVSLNGQLTAPSTGAGLLLGYGSNAFATANLTRGSIVNIANSGSAGAGLTIATLGGTGVLNASGGSQININAAPGLAYVKVGEDHGSNGAIILNNAGLNLGDGKLLLASGAGGNGSLTMSNQSALKAGYVGVGSSEQGDGGSARLIVNGSTLTANLLEIGGQGYVGGNGVLQAAIINRGTISPGNSPGTLTINGSFLNASGGKLLLEIAGDGSGGYITDHLLFTAGGSINMTGMEVTFHFLGATDPTAFLASGEFNIDQFIAQQSGGALDHMLFGGISYAARADGYVLSNFRFSADGGASFTAAPVPEPSSWMLLMTGLGALAVAARHNGRRKSSAGAGVV